MNFFFNRARIIAAPPDKVFDTAVADVGFLSRSVRRHGPIPGVREAHIVKADRLRIDAIRRVTLTSGGVLNEQITAFDTLGPTFRMAYRQLTGFPFPISLISRAAQGEYLAEPCPEGTRFIWRARHELTSSFVYPLAALARALWVHPLMQGYVDAVAAEVESQTSAPGLTPSLP